MKETEITIQVFESKEKIFEKLINLGFKIVRDFQLNDWYFTKFDDVKQFNYQELISHSILLRQIISDTVENQICYKNKEYNEKGDVICEEKIKTKIENIEKTKQILINAGLNNYCTIFNKSYVFEKQSMQFAVQIIEDLGIFIEYEEDDSMPKFETIPEKINYMVNAVKSLGLEIGDDYSCKKVEMILKDRF